MFHKHDWIKGMWKSKSGVCKVNIEICLGCNSIRQVKGTYWEMVERMKVVE